MSDGRHFVVDGRSVYWADEDGNELASIDVMPIPDTPDRLHSDAEQALIELVRAVSFGNPPTGADA